MTVATIPESSTTVKAMGGATRFGRTVKLNLTDPQGHTTEGYITGNVRPDGTIGEVFMHGFGKEGSTLEGWTQFSAILLSLSLQAGTDFASLARRIGQMKFEPYGRTTDPAIPFAPSVPAYIVAWLALTFGDDTAQQGINEVMKEWKL